MPKFKLKARDLKTYEKLKKAVDGTVIVQRQKDLAYGRWDFVVFGASSKDETVVRRGYAEYGLIHRAPVYIASVGEPGLGHNMSGMPIEEFIGGEDVPDDYRGLEIFQLSPARPLTISEKKTLGAVRHAGDTICKEYEGQNIAVIHAPHESDWAISVMHYLHECDRHFPDRVVEAFRSRAGGDFITFPGRAGSLGYVN
ncbi:MAG: hypothetical protein HZA01_02840 [Nitrospinae bacterium]|nr:hypothetical protein [Nitrospinota bacterium]